MHKLTHLDLMSLEQYARERPGFRARLIEYRRTRALVIGEHCSWSFEDRLTVQYQVQEMLRTERTSSRTALPRSWRSTTR